MGRLAAVGAVLGLLAVACGGGGTTSAGAIIRGSPAKTADARTSRIDLFIERPPAKATPGGVAMRVAGEVDYQARKGHMTLDLSQLGLPGAPVDAVFEGSTVYEKLPAALAGGIPGNKPWVKIDAAAAGRRIGVDISALGTAQSGDPSQTLDYLRGASDNVTRVGTDDVRGTQTTHYKATLDLNKAADRSPRARDAIKSLVNLLGFSQLPADIWVDAEGRLRKLRYTTDLSKSKVAASTPGAAGSFTFTLELFDFGVPVQVKLPPADQVVDLSSLAGGGQGGP